MLDSEQAAYLVGGADIETHQGSGVLLLKGLVLVTRTVVTHLNSLFILGTKPLAYNQCH